MAPSTIDEPARLQAAVALAESALAGRATVSCSVADGTATLTLSDGWHAADVMYALLTAGYTADYRGRSGDRIWVRWDQQRHATRRRVPESELTAERMTLAWCMERWGRSQHPGAAAPYAEMWRHVLECGTVDGGMDLGVAHSGACPTCFHEYPAVLWWVRCGCGLLRIGAANDPDALASPTGDPWSMATIVAELAELRARYLAGDAPHPMWMPGISRSR